MKRVVIGVCAAIVLIIAAEIAGYYVALNSDAYTVASKFVSSDAGLAAQIGPVLATRLSPFDAELRFTMNTGQAKFIVTAETRSGPRRVMVRLDKVGAAWKVIDSSLAQ
jgi:hypothetical protein